MCLLTKYLIGVNEKTAAVAAAATGGNDPRYAGSWTNGYSFGPRSRAVSDSIISFLSEMVGDYCADLKRQHALYFNLRALCTCTSHSEMFCSPPPNL